MTPARLYRDFLKLPGGSQWQFVAMVELWRQRRKEKLYGVARAINHEFGFDWTDPRTGRTYPAPEKAKLSHGSRAVAHPSRRQEKENRHLGRRRKK
jgi:exoribonuclease II